MLVAVAIIAVLASLIFVGTGTMMEHPAEYYGRRFGSAHPDAFGMVFADNSVRRVSYEVDLQVHRNCGNRNDGVPLDIRELEGNK